MTPDWIAIVFFSHWLPLVLLLKFVVYGLRAAGRGRV